MIMHIGVVDTRTQTRTGVGMVIIRNKGPMYGQYVFLVATSGFSVRFLF